MGIEKESPGRLHYTYTKKYAGNFFGLQDPFGIHTHMPLDNQHSQVQRILTNARTHEYKPPRRWLKDTRSRHQPHTPLRYRIPFLYPVALTLCIVLGLLTLSHI